MLRIVTKILRTISDENINNLRYSRKEISDRFMYTI